MATNFEYFVADLELRLNNPYSLSKILTFDDGISLLDSPQISYDKSPNDRYYTVEDKDNYQDIADAAYGDSKWWWIIYMVNHPNNPELDDPFVLPVSTTLLIPDLETFKLKNA